MFKFLTYCIMQSAQDLPEQLNVIEMLPIIENTFARTSDLGDVAAIVATAGTTNAGIIDDTAFLRMDTAQWDRVQAVNLDGAFRCTRAALKLMVRQRSGHLLNVSSYAALHPVEGQANYAASKAALNGLTQCVLTSVAITAKNGAVSFLTSPETNSGWGRIAGEDTGREIISLDGMTFDHFVSTQGIRSVDFLKVDIEGHELSLLEGGQNTLGSGVVKRALVEFCGYHMEKRNTTLADFIAAFERLGFRPCRLSMEKVESARRGTYSPKGEILNLLFEHSVLSAKS